MGSTLLTNPQGLYALAGHTQALCNTNAIFSDVKLFYGYFKPFISVTWEKPPGSFLDILTNFQHGSISFQASKQFEKKNEVKKNLLKENIGE